MLKLITIIIMYLIGFVSFAQTTLVSKINSDKANKYQIEVTINNIISNKGKVYFALYDSENGFNQKQPVSSKSAEIEEGVSKVNFENLEPKTYAVVCYHDSNENGKMDFQDNGMPIEDYGATNNIFNYGPPQFSDAKFELIDKDLTFEIKF